MAKNQSPHKIQQEIIKLKEKISTLKGKQERRWLGFQIPKIKSEDDRTDVEVLTENSGTQPEERNTAAEHENPTPQQVYSTPKQDALSRTIQVGT